MEKVSCLLLVFAISATGARDLSRRQLQQHCDIICNEELPLSKPVCGSNGVLYNTRCDYSNALCKARQSGTSLTYASIGPECVTSSTSCNVLLQTTCVNIHPFPVTNTNKETTLCGSDGKTYGSICELMTSKCKMQAIQAGAQLEVDHDGPCEVQLTNGSRQVNCSKYVVDLGGLALESGTHTTLRVRPCEKIYKPVCGLDGRTYGNECMFCGHLAYTHQIQSGHTTVNIKYDGSCTHPTEG